MGDWRDRWCEEFARVYEGDAEGEAYHGPATKTNLKGVTSERASARPVSGAHSIGEIVLHLLAYREMIAERLEGRPRDGASVEDWPAYPGADSPAAAWEGALGRLESSQRRLLAGVKNVRGDLAEKAEGWARFILHHELYHSGQIGLLRKG